MSLANDDAGHKDDGVAIKQGLRQNLSQFVILIVVNAFVGAMIGLEQTVVPLIGKNEFSIESNAMILSFIASFGLVRAILNLYAGSLAEKGGMKKVLILGWLFGIPVPFILLFAPDWNWIIFANVLLGVNQALAWSMTVNMKIDLMGKERRGLALGLNEFAGYLSVAVVGFATGYLASVYGLKPIHFTLELALSLLVYCFLSLLSGIQRSSCILRLKTIRCRKEGAATEMAVFLSGRYFLRHHGRVAPCYR